MDSYQQTFETWDKLASLYEDKFMDLALYNDTYDLFCNEVEQEQAKVLEVGCGPGNVTRYLLTKRPDFEIVGVDTSPSMIERAKRNNPEANFKVMDCREIDVLTTPFDAILVGFCMPYLSKNDCAKLIKDCAALLKNEGTLYLSTIEGDYAESTYETSSNGEHRMFVYYHECAYLQAMLKENHFDELTVIRKAYPNANATSTHLILLARKKLL